MFTAVVVAVILVFWFIAHSAYESGRRWKDRRKRAAWAWALVGAICGSFFGVAGGPLGAIAGTIPGAILGYLFASNLMKRDYDEDTTLSTAPPTRASVVEALVDRVNYAAQESTRKQQAEEANRKGVEEEKARTENGWSGWDIAQAAFGIGMIVWLLFKFVVSPAASPPRGPTNTAPAVQRSLPRAEPAPTNAVPVQRRPLGPRTDVRDCLNLQSNADIARCAERRR